MFFVGITFDPKENKEYKTENGGRTAAEKKGMRLFGENGETLADFTEQTPQDGTYNDEQEEAVEDMAEANEGGNGPYNAEEKARERGTMSDAFPYGEIEPITGSDGRETPPDLDEPEKEIREGEMVKVRGTIRRKFDGYLRLRNRPSWDASAVAGVTHFNVKRVVGVLKVDGKLMYKTNDGFFITGEPELVEAELEETP